MTTLPTPQQLVINGLKYFLRMNEKVQVGEPLGEVTSPTDNQPRKPDGICFYVKVNLWWHELPNWYHYEDQRKLINAAEDLIDELIKPYIKPSESYLPQQRILTALRLKVASQILSKLQEQQDDTTTN